MINLIKLHYVTEVLRVIFILFVCLFYLYIFLFIVPGESFSDMVTLTLWVTLGLQ